MKSLKKIVILTMILVFIGIFIQNTTAEAASSYDWNTKINSAATANATGADGAINATRTISQSIITIARVISMGVAVVMLIVLAMKYMMAAPGEKATIKKSAVIYIVGAIVMFASYGILTIIQQFATVI